MGKSENQQLHRFPIHAVRANQIVDLHPLKSSSIRSDYFSEWFKSDANPEHIVKGFSHLSIKEGYKLRAYQFHESGNGNGIVWAIPEDTELPEPSDCNRLEQYYLSPPKPKFALDDFMQVIEGDKTPLSYLQAAITYQELHEFGAQWHGIAWGRDTILPSPSEDSKIYSQYQWEMIEEEPEIIEPHFYYNSEGNPVIVFHTINDIAVITMKRYVCTFDKSDYTLTVEVTRIAEAGFGIIF
ncbi:hypothetical protein [Paenibacillus sp. JDR-2]|uniref:hypothetical protein n=1 Tax=Paenibacillus sp. (strain JDR-2) TaxID=324057 RepID=UPI0001668DDE|nr:hypothetical protein [Paenibacillus sp. JDR-2]ACT03361.1 hypothetical protein Pjdr2_4748 [Paenibacillus sp. JDR-2]